MPMAFLCSSAHHVFLKVSALFSCANSLNLLIRSFRVYFRPSTIRHERSWSFTPMSFLCSSAHLVFLQVSALFSCANSLIRSFWVYFRLSTIRHERSWPFTPITWKCPSAHPIFLKVSALFSSANLFISLIRSFQEYFWLSTTRHERS
jgi:hypothetical protein